MTTCTKKDQVIIRIPGPPEVAKGIQKEETPRLEKIGVE